jgi:hypothetical protein
MRFNEAFYNYGDINRALMNEQLHSRRSLAEQIRFERSDNERIASDRRRLYKFILYLKFSFRMSGLSKFDFRNRENKSQSVEQNFLLLKLISSGDYAIANSRACTRVKNLSSDEYKDAYVVKHGYGNDRVVGEVVKIGPVSILKDFINKNGLASPSDKKNSKSSKYILDQINLNNKI